MMESALSVGAQLRHVRTALRINIADVTAATKIQPWVLEAMESDQLQATMSPVYAKSFLIAYAKFLRLDPHPLLAQLSVAASPGPFAAAAAPAAPAEAGAPPEEAAASLEAMQSAVGSWILRAIPVAAVAVGVWVFVAAKPLRWLPSLRVTHASFSAPIKIPAPAKTGSPAAARVPVTAQIAPVKTAPASSASVHPAQPLELGIVARRSSWVSVKTDGNLVAQQQLAPGAKETWTARRRIEVIIGKPANVDVLLNGQPISPLALAHDGRLLITPRGVAALEDGPQ